MNVSALDDLLDKHAGQPVEGPMDEDPPVEKPTNDDLPPDDDRHAADDMPPTDDPPAENPWMMTHLRLTTCPQLMTGLLKSLWM